MSLFSLATQDKASWIFKLDGTIDEVSGNGLTSSTCTITGSPTFKLTSATGGLGSYLFDQSEGQEMVYFTGTRSPSLSGYPVFETVVKIGTLPTSTSTTERVIIRGESSDGFGSRQLSINQQANGTISNPRFTASNTGTTTFSVTSNININDGQWHHLMGIESLSGNNTKLDLYVDGVLSATGTSATNIGREQPNNVRIGSRSTGTTFSFYGTIDFAAIYNQGYSSTPTFTSTTVTNHYNDFVSTKNSYVEPTTLPYQTQISNLGPKLWYKFNETAGTPTNSGSLTNTVTAVGSPLLNEQTDVDGRAIYFNGTDAAFSLTNFPQYSLFDDKSFTMETWFKTPTITTSDSARTIFGARSNLDASLIRLRILNTSGNLGKIEARFSEQSSVVTQLTSPLGYADNQWHHIAWTINTTSQKLYIDGQLVVSSSTNINSIPAAFDGANGSGGTDKSIGRWWRNGVSATDYYKGHLDEFAVYDRELTAAEIIANFKSGSAVQFNDIAGTASALAVQPTLSIASNISVSPMTANATLPLPNATMYPQGLDSKLSSYALETWYKFDLANGTKPYNYGTGGQIGSTDYGFYPADGEGILDRFGPNATSAARLGITNELGQIQVYAQNQFTTEISDNNFSLGVWFKIDGTENVIRRIVNTLGASTNSRIYIYTDTNGYIRFQYRTTSSTNEYTGSIDLRNDGTWHYAAIRVNGTNVRYYLDGTEVDNRTVSGNRDVPEVWRFGNTGLESGSSYFYISNFYVTGHSTIDATAISEIWTVGNSAPQTIQAKSTALQPKITFFNKFNDKLLSYNTPFAIGLDNTEINNYGEVGSLPSAYIVDSNVTKLIPTKNRHAWQFKDTDQTINFNTSDISPEANGYTFGFYAKMTDPGQGNYRSGMQLRYDTFDPNPGDTFAILIGANDAGPFAATATNIYDLNSLNQIDTNNTSLFNDYHLYLITKDVGTDTWKFYIDGKLFNTETDSTASSLFEYTSVYINEGGTMWDPDAIDNVLSPINWDNYVDEAFFIDHALTAQEVFELWQSIEITRADAIQSSFPLPTFAAGFGPTINAAPATASSLFVNPSVSNEVIKSSTPLTASALFVLPNYGGNVVIDANYGHTTATANALFHMPQFNIGEFNSADHMDASALMVHPIAIGGGTIAAPTAVAQDAILVMPGIVTIKGARVFAEPAVSKAFFPLPPAYLQLTDDQWYVRLYGQHATQNIEAAFVTGNLPNTATTQIAKTYLKFFEDVTSSITVGNGYLENNLEEKLFLSPGSTNTTKTKVYPSIASSLTPTPALYTGYYDDFSRKAVRVNNIEFALPEEIYKSKEQFSLEFSIKTTKANQIIAQGKWSSFLYYQRDITGLGLYNGKLYLMNTNTTAGVPGNRTPHPANPDVAGSNLILGRTNIADGKWHHVVVQVGFGDNRMQFWVDGKLDIQKIGGAQVYSRLYIIGSNNINTTYQADFETSAWSYDKQEFLSEQNISLNYIGYLKYEPIKAEPMKATITMTDKNTAAGNRGRAIVFYFWPEETSRQIAPNPPINSIRGGRTLAGVSTDDFFKQPPQEWYGWDMYPVDVTGRYVSELVKEEAYGVENIKIQTPSFAITTGANRDPLALSYKVNSNGYFRDPITDDRRYIDVFNDIDLSQFDAIFFKNYPEESFELDTYARDEFVDQYFNLREKEIFERFLVSLRKGLDTGISLFVTNHQLAIDLGIIDRVEVVSNMTEQDFTSEDDYVTATVSATGINAYDTGWYPDLAKNNKFRVVNTLENLTNESGYIWKDWFFFQNDSTLDFGGPDRPYTKIEYRPNGLQVGDEFIISDDSIYGSRVKATPFANVKAGKIITAFGNNVLQNNTSIENPYKNYATSIAVEPGTILKGKPTVGKIFVNFTERFQYDWDGRDPSREYMQVDLIQDEFINAAYNDGEITLAKRNELLASADNLDRKLEAAIAAGNQTLINQITKQKYWTGNGEYIIGQKKIIEDVTGAGTEKDGIGKGVRKGRVNRLNKKGTLSTQTISSTSAWFTFEYSWIYPRQQFVVASMLTRGIRWLSDRVIDDGTVVRTETAKNLNATLPMPVVTADKDRTYYAQAMFANARIIHAPGYALASVSNTSLPLFADAKFGDFVKNIKPDVFTATAAFRQDVRTVGIQEDEIVLYIMHVDPIVYLREEVIK